MREGVLTEMSDKIRDAYQEYFSEWPFEWFLTLRLPSRNYRDYLKRFRNGFLRDEGGQIGYVGIFVNGREGPHIHLLILGRFRGDRTLKDINIDKWEKRIGAIVKDRKGVVIKPVFDVSGAAKYVVSNKNTGAGRYELLTPWGRILKETKLSKKGDDMPELTKSDKIRHDLEKKFVLSEKHHIAIRELVSGKTDEEVAKSAGVTRQTISEWRNNNPVFRTELTNKRAELWKAYIRPLQDAIPAAFETINKAIKDGDVKTAKWFLDKIGIDNLVKNNMQKLETASTDIVTEAQRIAQEPTNEDTERQIQDYKETNGIGEYLDGCDDKGKEYYTEVLNRSEEELKLH